MVDVPHPIPYQGSKRNLAHRIIGYFPKDADRLIEPFAGSAAITIAAASQKKVKYFTINDINVALMDLWKQIINNPDDISDAYARLWIAQQGRERLFYDEIRDKFNKTHRPDYFLYLVARCVKASIRYNSFGEFNQSPDNRRKGTHPRTMRRNIVQASRLLKSKVAIECVDYRTILNLAVPKDIIYMDPPYQGVCNGRDQRYVQDIVFGEFIDALSNLNNKNISYILSYDGKCGLKTYGNLLPDSLGLTHVELPAGRSTQSTLLGRKDYTIESLYLSPALISRLHDRYDTE